MTLLRQGAAYYNTNKESLCKTPLFPENKGMLISRIVKHQKKKKVRQNIQAGHRSHH